MAQTLNLTFLLENAPSEEYRQELLKLIKPSKTEYMKTKFKTLMSFLGFIESEYNNLAKKIFFTSNNLKCKIYGSFVRQYFEMIYTTPADKAYGDVHDHDIDIRLFDEINNDFDNNFMASLIQTFKTIIISKNDEFNFNGYKLLYHEDKTITKVNQHDAEGKKLLQNISHYFIVLEKDDDQIHIDLLAHKPIIKSSLWNKDFDVNGLYMCRNGISVNDGENFFKIQNSIMNRSAIVTFPINKFIDPLKNTSLDRTRKVELYNQLIHFITFRTKIEEIGYTQVSDEKMLSLTIEEKEPCTIVDFEAPYINVEFECSHNLSIMAFAQIVNIRASSDTEAIVCPYCRANLIPKLIDSKPFKKIEIPEIPKFECANKERVKKLNSSKQQIMMSEENLSCVAGLFQGVAISEVRENHERNELFLERYELIGNSSAVVIDVRPQQNYNYELFGDPLPLARM